MREQTSWCRGANTRRLHAHDLLYHKPPGTTQRRKESARPLRGQPVFGGSRATCDSTRTGPAVLPSPVTGSVGSAEPSAKRLKGRAPRGMSSLPGRAPPLDAPDDREQGVPSRGRVHPAPCKTKAGRMTVLVHLHRPGRADPPSGGRSVRGSFTLRCGCIPPGIPRPLPWRTLPRRPGSRLR